MPRSSSVRHQAQLLSNASLEELNAQYQAAALHELAMTGGLAKGRRGPRS